MNRQHHKNRIEIILNDLKKRFINVSDSDGSCVLLSCHDSFFSCLSVQIYEKIPTAAIMNAKLGEIVVGLNRYL